VKKKLKKKSKKMMSSPDEKLMRKNENKHGFKANGFEKACQTFGKFFW
jgi:hypothetical protein